MGVLFVGALGGVEGRLSSAIMAVLFYRNRLMLAKSNLGSKVGRLTLSSSTKCSPLVDYSLHLLTDVSSRSDDMEQAYGTRLLPRPLGRSGSEVCLLMLAVVQRLTHLSLHVSRTALTATIVYA